MIEWEDVPRALMFAGIFDTPLAADAPGKALSQAEFLSVGHEATMARITNEHCTKLKEVFDKFDEDRSGQLETDEFAKVFKECFKQDLTEEEVDRLTDEWDDDRNGTVGLNEFYAIVSRQI